MSTYGTPYVYHPDLSSACWAELPDGEQIECADCSYRCSVEHLTPLRRVFERVQPGDSMPDGECPECGSSCYATEPEAPCDPLEMLKAEAREEGRAIGTAGTDHWNAEQHVTEAYRLLLAARDHLKRAKAPKATAKVRAAITSTQGAMRHAQGMATRTAEG